MQATSVTLDRKSWCAVQAAVLSHISAHGRSEATEELLRLVVPVLAHAASSPRLDAVEERIRLRLGVTGRVSGGVEHLVKVLPPPVEMRDLRIPAAR